MTRLPFRSVAQVLPLLAALLIAACGDGSSSASRASPGGAAATEEMSVGYKMSDLPPAAASAPGPMRTRSGPVAEQSMDQAGGDGRLLSGTIATSTSSAVADSVTPAAATVPSMLIRTGNAIIEVDSLELAVAAVQAMARNLGGFVSSTNLLTGQGQARMATLELKIPNARFDQATGALTPLGKVESLVVNTEDVGEEFVDVTARVTNARRLEGRLIELLVRRTGKLEEVLAVEREIARVREEIERYDGRLRYLRTRVALSTLTVTVHEEASVLPPRAGPSPIGGAFRDAWRNFVGFVATFIAALGWLVPLLALLLVAALAWRRWGPRIPGGPTGPGASATSATSGPPDTGGAANRGSTGAPPA